MTGPLHTHKKIHGKKRVLPASGDYSSRSITSIACAAFLAAPRAWITVAVPVAASPPAYTFHRQRRNASPAITVPRMSGFNFRSFTYQERIWSLPSLLPAVAGGILSVVWFDLFMARLAGRLEGRNIGLADPRGPYSFLRACTSFPTVSCASP